MMRLFYFKIRVGGRSLNDWVVRRPSVVENQRTTRVRERLARENPPEVALLNNAVIKNIVYPCKPHFHCIKVEFKGVYISQTFSLWIFRYSVVMF